MKTRKWFALAMVACGVFSVSGIVQAAEGDEGAVNWFGGPIYEGQSWLWFA